MNSRNLTFAIGLLMAGTFFASCETVAQKDAAAQNDARNQQDDTRDQNATLAAQRNATAAEWETYRNERDIILTRNETRVAELRAQVQAQGSAADQAYIKRLDALEQQNKDFRGRLNSYQNNRSDWTTFRRDFTTEMDAYGRSLNNFHDGNKN